MEAQRVEQPTQSQKDPQNLLQSANALATNLDNNIVYHEKGHIALVGATNSGKTTNLISQLFHSGVEGNPFKSVYEYFFNIGSSLTDQKTVDNIREAALSLISSNKNIDDFNNNFYHYTERDFVSAIQVMQDLKTKSDSLLKLGFFDDIQQIVVGGDSKKLSAFINQAKNANCHLIITMHKMFNIDKNTISMRDACRYFVLFNVSEQDFKRILNKKQSHASAGDYLWSKYISENDVYKRVVIFDSTVDKIYWGYPPYERFDPLINNSSNASTISDKYLPRKLLSARTPYATIPTSYEQSKLISHPTDKEKESINNFASRFSDNRPTIENNEYGEQFYDAQQQ